MRKGVRYAEVLVHDWVGVFYIDRRGYGKRQDGSRLHRLIVAAFWKQYRHPVYGTELPTNFHVHHMDFQKEHCCICNLLVLDGALHSATSNAWLDRGDHGKWAPSPKAVQADSDVPDWVTEGS
jgi:hypothetical protein